MGSANALILDQQLSPPARAIIEETCLGLRLPFFYRVLPSGLGELDTERMQEALARFLEDHNIWRNELPSPETFDRIELRALLDIITTANSLLQPREVMEMVMNRIHQLIPCGAWSVLILDNNADQTLSFAAACGPVPPSFRDSLTMPPPIHAA